MCRSIYRYHWARKFTQEIDNLNILFDKVAISIKPQLLWVIFYYDLLWYFETKPSNMFVQWQQKRNPSEMNTQRSVLEIICVCVRACVCVWDLSISTSYLCGFKKPIKYYHFGCGIVECLGGYVYALRVHHFDWTYDILLTSVSTCIPGHNIFIIGGYNYRTNQIVDTIEYFNTRKNKWYEIFSLGGEHFSSVDVAVVRVPESNRWFSHLTPAIQGKWTLWWQAEELIYQYFISSSGLQATKT